MRTVADNVVAGCCYSCMAIAGRQRGGRGGGGKCKGEGGRRGEDNEPIKGQPQWLHVRHDGDHQQPLLYLSICNQYFGFEKCIYMGLFPIYLITSWKSLALVEKSRIDKTFFYDILPNRKFMGSIPHCPKVFTRFVSQKWVIGYITDYGRPERK